MTKERRLKMKEQQKQNEQCAFKISIAYIHGRIEAQLEGFAASLGVPARQLTARVATLLLGPEGREVLGAQDRLPRVPRKAAKRSEPVEPVEVASGSHADQAHVKPLHWTQTPKGRKRMAEIARSRRRAPKAA